jgi:catechol 2,3-dioxygenase-like lactoylglutathione lyase family enzyme
MPTAILDHIGFPVSDFARARAFYAATLKPLGIGVVMEVSKEMTGKDEHVGFGIDTPEFWIGSGMVAKTACHVAFIAKTRAAVDAFYTEALAHGGTDNGPPGVRAHYHKHYYAAFVFDPDGNNIEAVCHAPDTA